MIRLLNVYYPTRTLCLLLSELLLIGGCLTVALLLRLGSDAYIALNYEHGTSKLLLLTLLTLTLSYYFNLYETELITDRQEISFRILLVVGCMCLLVAGMLYFFPDFAIAQNVFALGFGLLAFVLVAWRKIFDWIMGKEIFRETVYVLGGGEYAEGISDHIRTRPDMGMRVVGCDFSLLDEVRKGGLTTRGRTGTAEEAVACLLAMKYPVRRVIVAMQDRRGELPMRDLLDLRFRGVVIEEAGSLLERLTGRLQLDGLRPSTFLFSEGFRIRPSQQLTRRIVSTLAAGMGLLLFAPLFPLVVLTVRLSSPGPIFYKQTRVGEGGRHFNVYKFRTMRQDAEAAGAKWASKNDPRVTRAGMFMRKTRIDEVPQLWCVLRGDMSFVGPRPERPEFVPWLAEQLPFYNLRHMIRPGLTGWAQVRYGYGATLEESRIKLEHDLYYIKHMSLGLDLVIMFETIKTILHRKGAQ